MWWCKIRCNWTTIRSYSRKVKRSFQATTEVIQWHQMQGVGAFRRPHHGPLQVILLSHPCFSIKIISCRGGEDSWIQRQWLKRTILRYIITNAKSSIIAWFCDNIFHGTAEAVPTTAISKERNKYATMIVIDDRYDQDQCNDFTSHNQTYFNMRNYWLNLRHSKINTMNVQCSSSTIVLFV
jgi:hypothetical protein